MNRCAEYSAFKHIAVSARRHSNRSRADKRNNECYKKTFDLNDITWTTPISFSPCIIYLKNFIINQSKLLSTEELELLDEDDLRKTDREKNISIYGDQTFSIDSQYIQTLSQARSMMQWILRNCGRQRIKLSMEVFENPLIELGDKVKIFDKSKGYFIENDNFGQKTFVVSSISRSVNNSNVAMTISLTEVGES